MVIVLEIMLTRQVTTYLYQKDLPMSGFCWKCFKLHNESIGNDSKQINDTERTVTEISNNTMFRKHSTKFQTVNRNEQTNGNMIHIKTFVRCLTIRILYLPSFCGSPSSGLLWWHWLLARAAWTEAADLLWYAIAFWLRIFTRHLQKIASTASSNMTANST